MSNQTVLEYEILERAVFGDEPNSAKVLEQKNVVKKVFDVTRNFLAENKLLSVKGREALQNNTIISLEGFNGDAQLANMAGEHIDAYVKHIGVPTNLQATAKKSLIQLLAKFKSTAGDNSGFMSQHFSKVTSENDAAHVAKDINAVFAPGLFRDVTNIGVPGMEDFGVNMDTVLPDISGTITISMLQYFRGLTDRIIHRRAQASPFVTYVVPYAEIFDILESNAATSEIRNHGDHIVPFINLYGDPKVVSNILQPIIPTIASDKKGVVYSDGFLKMNVRANIFDASIIAEKMGHTHINHTDIVADNVFLDSVLVQVTDIASGKKEVFQIETRNLNQSRLYMQSNATESAVRAAIINHAFKLTNTSETITGAPSEIFAPCTPTDHFRVAMRVVPTISLKTADVEAIGNVMHEAYNVNGGTPSADVATLAAGLKFEIVAFQLDARYSEENLRKSNLSLRVKRRPFYFEVSNGRNIIVDYSQQQDTPEDLMSLVGEATSLGQDHRAIDTVVKTLMHVFDVTRLENEDPNFQERLDKIGFQYPASQLVRPMVLINTIDLIDLNNLREGDLTGDIRSKVEWALLNLFSVLNQNSYYKRQLNAGETPVFKCVTSNIILDNILAVPHYHNHLNKEESVDGNNIEYRRVLSNGIILDIVTSTYDYLRDKIVMIPYREGAAESILNFAHNFDCGMYVSQYKYQNNNAMNNRIFANSRTMVIPSNPIGLYLEVRNISQITDMYQIINPTGSKLPQPSEINP